MNWKLGFEENKRRLRTTPRSPVFDDVASNLHKPRWPALLVPNHARLDSCPVVNIPPLFLGHPIPNPNIGQGTLLGAPASSPAAVVIRGGWLLARLARQRCAKNATHRSPNSTAHRRLSQKQKQKPRVVFVKKFSMLCWHQNDVVLFDFWFLIFFFFFFARMLFDFFGKQTNQTFFFLILIIIN